jgi:raffinose/stachyose/melibiose transport system substrate-binding protein
VNRRDLLRLAGAGAGAAAAPTLLGGRRPARAASQESTTIRFWSWNPGEERGQQFFDAFNQSHPNITIEYSNSEYNDYLTELRLGMASGEGPDLLGIQAGAMLQEYGEFLEDLTPYAVETWGGAWRDRFYAIGIDQLMAGEQALAMPFMNSAAGYVWYNKTILDEHGLQPPATWDEWVQLSQALSEQGVTPFIQGAKDPWVNYDMYIALANEIAPAKIYQAEAGEVPWTDPDLVQAMDYWGQLFQNGIMQEGALGLSQYPDAHDEWVQGGAAMILFGMWNNDHMTQTAIDGIQSELGFEEDYVFLPFLFPDVNGDGQPGRLFGGPDVGLAMNNGSEVKDAVWEFISWCVEEEAQRIWATTLTPPSVKGFEMDPSDVITEEQRQNLEQQLVHLESSVGKREFLYPELKTALADALQNVATGDQSPDDAMAAVEEVSQTIER